MVVHKQRFTFQPSLSVPLSLSQGAVDKLLVKEGDEVSEGDVLAVVVAMKMEVQVKAPMAGTVASVHVAEGGKVVEGALLAKVVGKMTLTKSAENLASVKCA